MMGRSGVNLLALVGPFLVGPFLGPTNTPEGNKFLGMLYSNMRHRSKQSQNYFWEYLGKGPLARVAFSQT